MDFRPHPLLRSPHLQTLLSSRVVRGGDGIGADLLQRAEAVILEARDGARLQALVDPPRGSGSSEPLVVVIHGWLGRADSPYVRRAAAALHAAGFRVARLHLRDHGDTAHLNEELFNAARIVEVVDACNALASAYGADGAGLLGFSLGGNFVLRLAAHPEISPAFGNALAVCPVLDPASAVTALDRGWIAYQRYFLGKWRRAFDAKQAVFPQRYDFRDARALSLVSTLTDYFVSRHTPFRDADEYYAHYTLGPDLIGRLRMPVRLIAAEDDPVVPVAHARALARAPGGRDAVSIVPHGGHCGFLEDLTLRSALDRFLVAWFGGSAESLPRLPSYRP
jgi:uncharacterized protein